jgi:hypothetical protein
MIRTRFHYLHGHVFCSGFFDEGVGRFQSNPYGMVCSGSSRQEFPVIPDHPKPRFYIFPHPTSPYPPAFSGSFLYAFEQFLRRELSGGNGKSKCIGRCWGVGWCTLGGTLIRRRRIPAIMPLTPVTSAILRRENEDPGTPLPRPVTCSKINR